MTTKARSIRCAAIALAVTTFLPQSAACDGNVPGVILLAGTNQPGAARTSEKTKETESNLSKAPGLPGSVPVWVPRARHGAPAARVGGATRTRARAVTIQTLVPEVDEAALTLAAQPRLYWHLSDDTGHQINFTLVDPDGVDPIVDQMIAGPFEAGIHVVSLADYDAQLEPGGHYEWFVAVVPDPENRASDVVARGAIARVADPELASRVAESMPDSAALLLAQSGIWYEALDVVSQGMSKAPGDTRLRERRDAMLEQVGLSLEASR